MLTEEIYRYRLLQQSGLPTQTFLESESESKVWDAEQVKNLETRVEALEKHSGEGRVGISVQICDLNSPKYSLKKAFSLLVFYENGAYYAVPVDFDIFGEGGDEKSAIDDLKEVIVEYFENLNSSPSKLSKILKSKLKLLKTFIKNED